jgi:ribosomal protein S18 acetylase RimI-like enzyme
VTRPAVPGPTSIDALTVSAASVDDAEVILGLQRLAYQSEARLYGDWSIPPLTQTLEELREEFATTLVLKASVGGRLVGSVRAKVTEGACYVGRLIVHPDFQGRGIGSRLLREVEARFPEVDKYELFTGSRSEANLRLYRRHGYKATGTETFSPAVSVTHLEKAAGAGKSVHPARSPSGGGPSTID